MKPPVLRRYMIESADSSVCGPAFWPGVRSRMGIGLLVEGALFEVLGGVMAIARCPLSLVSLCIGLVAASVGSSLYIRN